MIASLPMYDRAETRAAYDRLWGRIREDLILMWKDRGETGFAIPDTLTHDSDPWHHWHSADLILSQTCGLPFRSELHHNVTLIGTPDYHLPGCPRGYYNSVLIMRTETASDDPAGWTAQTLAVNDVRSQSGYAAPVTFMSDLDLSFRNIAFTGSHRNSARAVLDGTADIAAIDAQTWRMIRRWDIWANELTEVARTEPTPGLPLISAQADAYNDLYAALSHQLSTLPDEDAALLDINGFVSIPKSKYLSVPTPGPSAK